MSSEREGLRTSKLFCTSIKHALSTACEVGFFNLARGRNNTMSVALGDHTTC